MEHLPEELNFIREHAEGIRLDFIHLTEQILKKDMKSANKQLQDTLMNYFLENQVGSLLKKPMNQNSKRAIRLHIEKELPETGTKYINLLNAFEKNLKQYEVANDYINLLKDIIVTPNNNEKSQDQWKALVRKRILAILLTVHWFVKNKEFNDFFQLWDEVYPNNPLPKRKPKQTRKKRNPDEKKKNLKIEEQSIPKIQNEDEEEDDEYDEDDHTQTQKQSSHSHLIKQEQQQQHQNYLDQYGNMNNLYNQQNFQNMQQQQIQQQIAAQQHSQPFINLKLLPMPSQQFGQGQYNGGDESYRAQQGQYNLDANTQYILKNGLGAESPMNILSPNPRDRQQQQYSQNNSPLNMNSSQLGMQYGQSNFSNVMNSYNYQNEFTPKLNNDKDQASYYQQMQMNYLMSTGQMTPFSNRGNTNFMNQDGNENKNFNQNNNTIAEENQESVNGENQNNNNNDLYKLNGNTPLNFNQGQNGANFSQYLQIQKNNSSYAQSPQNNNNQLSHFASFVKNLNQNSRNDNDSQNKQNNEGNKNKSQMDQNGIPLDNSNNANNNNGNLNNNQKNQNTGNNNNNNQHLRKKVILLQQTSQNQQELSPLNSPGMNYGHSPGLMGKFPQSQFFQYSQQQKINQQGQLINDEGNSHKMNQMKQVNFFKQNSYSLENTPQNILTQQFMNNNQNNNNGNDIKFDFDVANSPNNLLFQKIWENQALSRNGSQEMNGYNFENDKSPFNQGQFFGGFHNMLNHQQSQINQQQFNLTQQQSQVLQHQQSQQPQFQQQQNQQLIQQQQNNNNTNFNNNQIVQNNNIQNNNQTIPNNNSNQMEMEEQQQNQQEIQASSQ